MWALYIIIQISVEWHALHSNLDLYGELGLPTTNTFNILARNANSRLMVKMYKNIIQAFKMSNTCRTTKW